MSSQVYIHGVIAGLFGSSWRKRTSKSAIITRALSLQASAVRKE